VGSIPATGANYEIEDYDIPPNDYSDEAVRITASERGKTRYASASDMERARTRAALLPKDARFIAWIGPCREGKEDIEAAQYIRNVCCAGESRRLIAEDETCYRAFIAMETDFLISINALTEPR
jgi:ferredoxin-thioredoxin reductase catalytic subunit